jgi:hypothetical protein
MCLPAAVVGIVTAVTSAVSTIAQFSAQQAAVQQANAAARAQYQYQMAAYQQSERAYKSQMDLNAAAANRAYVQEQQKLDFEYRQAALEASELMAASMRAQGTLLASGRTGQSIGILANDADREYSRDLATLGLNLAYANNNYLTTAQGIQQQWESANNLAASQRQLKPSKPIMQSGPSVLGLVGGLAGSVMGGFSAFQGLSAPNPGGGGASFPFAGHATHSSVPMMPLPPVP